MSPQPVLDSFAQEIYDKLAPLAFDDENQNWALAYYANGIGKMYQIVDEYARDQGDLPGWSMLVDINRCPSEGLAWLAQFVGVTLQPGLSDVAQRARIKSTDGQRRGTPDAIVGAARQYLTGAQTVILRERDPAASATQPAYGLTVITYTSQTPDSNAVLAALLDQKPAGIVLSYRVLTGQDYQSLYVNHPTYSNVYSTYSTYEGLVTDQPGT